MKPMVLRRICSLRPRAISVSRPGASPQDCCRIPLARRTAGDGSHAPACAARLASSGGQAPACQARPQRSCSFQPHTHGIQHGQPPCSRETSPKWSCICVGHLDYVRMSDNARLGQSLVNPQCRTNFYMHSALSDFHRLGSRCHKPSVFRLQGNYRVHQSSPPNATSIKRTNASSRSRSTVARFPPHMQPISFSFA